MTFFLAGAAPRTPLFGIPDSTERALDNDLQFILRISYQALQGKVRYVWPVSWGDGWLDLRAERTSESAYPSRHKIR